MGSPPMTAKRAEEPAGGCKHRQTRMQARERPTAAPAATGSMGMQEAQQTPMSAESVWPPRIARAEARGE